MMMFRPCAPYLSFYRCRLFEKRSTSRSLGSSTSYATAVKQQNYKSNLRYYRPAVSYWYHGHCGLWMEHKQEWLVLVLITPENKNDNSEIWKWEESDGLSALGWLKIKQNVTISDVFQITSSRFIGSWEICEFVVMFWFVWKSEGWSINWKVRPFRVLYSTYFFVGCGMWVCVGCG